MYLPPKLHEVGEVLQALGHHDQGAGGRGGGRLSHQPPGTRGQQRGAHQAQEDET